jgi:hypothetical protein
MGLKIPNLSDVTPAGEGFDPLPAGWYNVRVENAEEVTASTGTPGIKMELAVTDGPYTGRKIWDRMWISEAGAGFIVQKLQAMNYPIPQGEFDLDAIELIGRRCAVKVEPRTYTKSDGTQGTADDVKAYDKVAGPDLPVSPAVPAVGGGGVDSDIPFAASKV